jgi:hypothetical protein
MEPSTHLEAHIGDAVSQEGRDEGYAEAAVMGIVDILMTAYPHPVKNVRISIEELEIHPVHSSRHAFRLAGRDAAARALKEAFGGR